MKKLLFILPALFAATSALANPATNQQSDTYVLGGIGSFEMEHTSGSNTSYNIIAGRDFNQFFAVEGSLNYTTESASAPGVSAKGDLYGASITPVLFFEPIDQFRFLVKAGGAYARATLTASTAYASDSISDSETMFTAGAAIQGQYLTSNNNAILLRVGYDRYFADAGDFNNTTIAIGYKF